MEHKFAKQIIEALLFASDIPLSETRLLQFIEGIEARQIRQYINEINEEYGHSLRSFMIIRVAGGYQIVTRPEFSPWIKQLLKGKAKTRLTQASLETLAIIAFKQPISRPQIEAIRGIQCDGVIKNLLERGLITIAGRADSVGRALLYKTTDEFLRYFGINEISDLPKPREIEDLIGQSEDLQFQAVPAGQRDLFGGALLEQDKGDNNGNSEISNNEDESDNSP
ncbi:SMC-Scp complex subunit ScpB [candidate division KSB1 bacterium]|nr:SMC-Scp complex subunit ScpB [candidate division KSB1 bacterium]